MVFKALIILVLAVWPSRCDLDYPYGYQASVDWTTPLESRSTTYYEDNNSEPLLLFSGLVR